MIMIYLSELQRSFCEHEACQASNSIPLDTTLLPLVNSGEKNGIKAMVTFSACSSSKTDLVEY